MATLTNISNYAYNPNLIQRDILNLIANNVTEISDPTSPFITLMEAAAISTSNNLLEVRSLLRKTYPYLASTREELFRHIHNSQFGNISATPSDVEFIFMLPINDITSNGYHDVTSNSYSTKIPHESIITVGGLYFTILNPISITIYIYDSVNNTQTKNIVVTEELHPDGLEIAYDRSGVIKHEVVTFKNQLYIKFKTRVKQLIQESKLYTTPVNGTLVVTSNIPNGYQFYHSDVYTRNSSSSDWYVVEKSLTDEYLDIYSPKCIVTITNDVIGYTIPEPYITTDRLGSQFMFNTYYTMGALNIPLYNVESQDFSIKYNNTSSSKAASTITKMTLNILSDGIVNGGSDQKTFAELKSAVINNTIGNNFIPITESELIQAGSLLGYTIKCVEDNLLQREYIATKEIDNPVVDYVYAAENMYVNTLKYRVNDYKTTNYSKILEVVDETSNNETMIIKPNNILRYDNGYLTILNDSETKEILENIDNKNIEKINELTRKNDYFINPFHYVITYDSKGVVTSEAYHITAPSITNTTLIGYNTSVSPNVSLNNVQLYYRENGYYELIFDLVYNDAYKAIPPKNRGYFARIQLANGDYVHYKLGFTSGGAEDDGKLLEYTYSLKIYTDFDLTTDGTIGVKNISENNGVTTASIPRLPFNPTIELFGAVLTSSDFTTYDNVETTWDNEIYKAYTYTANYTILSKNKITLNLAQHLPYLYRRSYYTYDVREYETYEENVYDTYKETQFNLDINGLVNVMWKDGTTGWLAPGSTFTYDDTFEDGDYTLPILDIPHKAGDIVEERIPILDANGRETGEKKIKRIILHAKGDIKRDVEGQPIVKASGNLIRYIDMAITDYLYYVSSSKYYQNYDDMFKRNIVDYIADDMPALNKHLLENTIMYFKPVKTIGTVSYTYGSSISYQNATVSPTITLYSNDPDYINKNLVNITARIGNILTDVFKENIITLENIRTLIKNELGDTVVAVKINNLTDDDAERIDLTNTHNRFILKKKVSIDDNKNIIIVYDIDIKTINTAI